MLGRLLNYLLVPLHTAAFVPAEYGVVTDIYALVAFAMVLLTFGLETAFFRYTSEKGADVQRILRTSQGFLLYTSATFVAALLLFRGYISDFVGYSDHPEYVIWMGLVLVFDALTAIPMAQLRQQERPIRFASINLAGIGVNIAINLFFIGYCMPLAKSGNANALVEWCYDPSLGVGYVFLANLFASLTKVVLLSPTLRNLSLRPDKAVLRPLLRYSLPLMVAGFAGIINETLDRRLIRVLLEPTLGETAALAQVGIYGACYKLSILVTLFTQAFRYAAEPFFFNKARDMDAKTAYADVMNWFTLAVSVMMTAVLLFLDVFKHFIRNESYWVGLHIVPILMVANLFLGWNYNLSVWYKLTNRTQFGTYIAFIGAVVTIAVNLTLIPLMGYTGAAWATLASYATMFVASWLWGRRYYRVPYDVKRLLGYPAAGLLLFALNQEVSSYISSMSWLFSSLLFALFLTLIWFVERQRIKRLLA